MNILRKFQVEVLPILRMMHINQHLKQEEESEEKNKVFMKIKNYKEFINEKVDSDNLTESKNKKIK